MNWVRASVPKDACGVVDRGGGKSFNLLWPWKSLVREVRGFGHKRCAGMAEGLPRKCTDQRSEGPSICEGTKTSKQAGASVASVRKEKRNRSRISLAAR